MVGTPRRWHVYVVDLEPRVGTKPGKRRPCVAIQPSELAAAGLAPHIMVDFSHANSSKKYERQVAVGADVASQLAAGEDRIMGVMVESNLKPGRQDLVAGVPLARGVSITDACIGWDDTVRVLDTLAEGVRKRRLVRGE